MLIFRNETLDKKKHFKQTNKIYLEFSTNNLLIQNN